MQCDFGLFVCLCLVTGAVSQQQTIFSIILDKIFKLQKFLKVTTAPE